MTCQKAINERIIPGSVTKKKEQRYSKYELKDYFNLKGALLNKYIKQGFLKVRIILGESKKIHHQLFLIKDNKHVLPPKKLPGSRTVKVMRNGEEYYTPEEWYEYIDIPLAKKIVEISDCGMPERNISIANRKRAVLSQRNKSIIIHTEILKLSANIFILVLAGRN